MIYRRREGGQVKPGLNVLWEPLAKGAILSTPWFSLHVMWNRHTRRLTFAVPYGFNWRAPLGPWRRIAEMRREIDRKEREVDRLQHDIAMLDHALHQSNERYDKIREANAQLRETLTLYRNA